MRVAIGVYFLFSGASFSLSQIVSSTEYFVYEKFVFFSNVIRR